MDKLDAIIIVPKYFDDIYFYMTHENDPWYEELSKIILDETVPMGYDECEWFDTHCWNGESIVEITLEDQESITEEMECIAWTVTDYAKWLTENGDKYNIVHTLEYTAY